MQGQLPLLPLQCIPLSCPPGCLPLLQLINITSLPLPPPPYPCPPFLPALECRSFLLCPSCSLWGGFGRVLGGALYPRQAPASRWGWQSLIPSIQPQQNMLRATVLQGSKDPPGCGCDLVCANTGVPRAGETPHFDSSEHPAGKPSCLLLHAIPGNRPCSIFSFSGVLDSSGFRKKHPPKPRQFPRSAKEPHQQLAVNTKMPNLEAWGFLQTRNLKAVGTVCIWKG